MMRLISVYGCSLGAPRLRGCLGVNCYRVRAVFGYGLTEAKVRPWRALLSQAQFSDERPVTIDILTVEVPEQPPPLAYQL
jgi:hypothetical protein